MDNLTFEEELDRHGSFLYTNTGFSMWPMIRPGKDLVEISRRPAERLKRFDVALYRCRGCYILHRVLRVRADCYLIAGDHNYRTERVTDDQIIGILSAVIRDGNRSELQGLRYRLYLLLWCDLFPLRAGILWICAAARRILGKAFSFCKSAGR